MNQETYSALARAAYLLGVSVSELCNPCGIAEAQ